MWSPWRRLGISPGPLAMPRRAAVLEPTESEAGGDELDERLSGSINPTAIMRIYFSNGEFLRYALYDAPLEGETIPENVVQGLFPTEEFKGKRVVGHRDGLPRVVQTANRRLITNSPCERYAAKNQCNEQAKGCSTIRHRQDRPIEGRCGFEAFVEDRSD
jgi:hypothetical protein